MSVQSSKQQQQQGFFVDALLDKTFDVSKNKVGQKKLAIIKKKFHSDDIVDYLAKVDPVVGLNHYVVAIVRTTENLSGTKFKQVIVEEEEKQTSTAKSNTASTGKGIGYLGGDAGAGNIQAAMAQKDAERLKQNDNYEQLFKSMTKVFGAESVTSKWDEICYACLNQSALHDLMVFFLRQNSVDEIAPSYLKWMALMDLCVAMSQNKNMMVLFRPKGLRLPARFARNGVDILALLKVFQHNVQLAAEANEANTELLSFAKSAKTSIDELEKRVTGWIAEINKDVEGAKIVDDTKYDDSDEKKSESSEKEIIEFLRTQQFKFCDLSAAPFIFSSYVSSSASAVPDKKRLLRIKKELSILSGNLPDGIFVRVNEDRMDIIKVLIIGPEGTPYENGCFLFDLYLAPEFPQQPPQMKLVTTGKGTFRFNPNLYTDGKICLSLLGTWSGPGWMPETSTLLQLLVSLQAMVLCDEPYCNEPAWYSLRGTPASKLYSKAVSGATALYAMLWHLEEQPAFFSEVTQAHFYRNKEYLKKQLAKWIEMANAAPGEVTCYGTDQTKLPKTIDVVAKDIIAKLDSLKSPL